MKMPYNTATIRELLRVAFDDQELTTLCYDHFRPVYDRFTAEMSRLSKIQLLIDHCARREEFDRLITLVQEINPKQYYKMMPLMKEISHVSGLDISSSKGQVEIIIKGDFCDFTPEVQYAAVGALAGVLDIPRDQVKVLAVRAGSIVLQIELPIEAVDPIDCLV